MTKLQQDARGIFDRTIGLATNDNGIIIQPGKFQGEPWWVPLFWNVALQGHYDHDDGDSFLFLLTDVDRSSYPGLERAKSVTLWESDQGFVHHSIESLNPGR